jgi:hypothetical protein
MKTAIEEYVCEEAYEREKSEDLARWQQYQLTGQAIAHAQVEQWLSSWGSDSELMCPK